MGRVRQARRAGDREGGRPLHRARLAGAGLREGRKGARRDRRVRQRAEGDRRARQPGLPGGAEGARQRRRARHARGRGRGVKIVVPAKAGTHALESAVKWSERCSLWLRIVCALYWAVIGYAAAYNSPAWVAFITIPPCATLGFFYPEIRDDVMPDWV